MLEKRPKMWFSPDFPSGWILQDSEGGLWRLPGMQPFDGQRSTLTEIREVGEPLFPTETFIDLVGVAEIASRAQVAAGTVHAWRSRHDDFPVPLGALASGPVWAWSSVERWLAIRPPMGRPRAVRVPVASPTVRAYRHLRGDGVRRTFELRDRILPGSLVVTLDGHPASADLAPTGRAFTLQNAPAAGADIQLDYLSTLG